MANNCFSSYDGEREKEDAVGDWDVSCGGAGSVCVGGGMEGGTDMLFSTTDRTMQRGGEKKN